MLMENCSLIHAKFTPYFYHLFLEPFVLFLRGGLASLQALGPFAPDPGRGFPVPLRDRVVAPLGPSSPYPNECAWPPRWVRALLTLRPKSPQIPYLAFFYSYTSIVVDLPNHDDRNGLRKAHTFHAPDFKLWSHHNIKTPRYRRLMPSRFSVS